MRKLVYECTKNGSVVKVTSMAQADELRFGGWDVKEVLEFVPEKTNASAKQMANRIAI